MGGDPTGAYFWPEVNKGPSQLWLLHFLTCAKDIFFNHQDKIEKIDHFEENFPNPEKVDPGDDPTQAADCLGSKFLAWTHLYPEPTELLRTKYSYAYSLLLM